MVAFSCNMWYVSVNLKYQQNISLSGQLKGQMFLKGQKKMKGVIVGDINVVNCLKTFFFIIIIIIIVN